MALEEFENNVLQTKFQEYSIDKPTYVLLVKFISNEIFLKNKYNEFQNGLFY